MRLTWAAGGDHTEAQAQRMIQDRKDSGSLAQDATPAECFTVFVKCGWVVDTLSAELRQAGLMRAAEDSAPGRASDIFRQAAACVREPASWDEIAEARQGFRKVYSGRAPGDAIEVPSGAAKTGTSASHRVTSQRSGGRG